MHLCRRTWPFALVVATACGGGGGSGTTEPPPSNNPPGNQQTLGSISVSPSSLSLAAGTTATLQVSAFDVQGNLIANPGNPVFTVANTQIAEVDAGGTVLALTAGSTQVSVSLTFGAVTRNATVPVQVTGTLPVSAEVVASSNDYVFTPRTVAISRGGSVTWIFGILTHNVVFGNQPGAPAGIDNGYSRTESRTFNTAGNFDYVCTIHAGMGGRVIVR